MVIRKAEISDLQRVAQIDSLSFPDPWGADYYRDELFNPIACLLVAGISSQLAGFLLYWEYPPEMELLRMAVDEPFRNHGTGAALLEHMLTTARAHATQRITLEVRRSNHYARRLYSGRNFLETGCRKGYYRDPPEDAILMEWGSVNAYKNRDLQ